MDMLITKTNSSNTEKGNIMFTDAEFVSAIVSAAANNPEFVYPVEEDQNGTCFYFEPEYNDEQAWHPAGFGSAPSCIIGHALSSCGVTTEMITNAGLQSEVIEDWKFRKFFKDNDIELSREALFFASVVQHAQDNSQPWGVAVEAGFGAWSIDIT